MTKEELLDRLESLVSRANNEKDYLGYALIDDFESLMDDYENED